MNEFDAKAEHRERAERVAAAQRLPQGSDAAAPAPAAAAAFPTEHKRRRRAAAQAARQGQRALLLAILTAVLVMGAVVWDFLHLRRGTETPSPPENHNATTASHTPQITAPEAVETPPPAQAPAALANSRPASAAGEPASQAPRPETEPSLAEEDASLKHAQAAFDRGNLDRAQSEARRAAAQGNPEADALLGAIAFKRGHLDEAERLLGKALLRDPGNPRIARQLQVVRARRGTEP